MWGYKSGAAALAALAFIISPALAYGQLLARAGTAEGAVISRKSGEEVRFTEIDSWRNVAMDQALLAGDTLRTNAAGALAILFSDDTQVRMGRNSSLLVKSVARGSDSQLELQSGTIWARAKRGGTGVAVETPAAAAAIRGTDWTLSVGAGGRTTLQVFEGSVSLTNAQGSVTVVKGEGAVAAVGEAPRKYILVNLAEREQMLLYSELQGIFSNLSVSTLAPEKLRAERKRLQALPEASRSSRDRITIAEAALDYDGRAAARAALNSLRRPLPADLEARAKLVEAMLAGADLRYEEAARLFKAALPGLDRERRAAAAYGLWFAQTLAHPGGKAASPGERQDDNPKAVLAQASIAAYRDGAASAIEIVKAGEKRFPHDARLPAARADLAFQLDRRDEAREAISKALAIDPDEPTALLVRGRMRSAIDSDLDGALADLKRAIQIAPGNDAAWNELGIVQSDRNAVVEADDAHRQAIDLNPQNVALYANYARFLMDNDQMKAAKAALDLAEKIDAKSYAVLAAKGRYLLRMGETEAGERALLEASAVNPTYGDGLIGLAIAAYQNGSEEEALQALDNAERYDPKNPSTPLIRSGIALDQFRADEAIMQAREALRRRQARGGYYSDFDANRQTTSFLGVALENIGLSEWASFQADRGFDPFLGSSYVDEAAQGVAWPFVGHDPLLTAQDRSQPGDSTASSNLQARLLDPLSVASQYRRTSIERREFIEASAARNLRWQDGEFSWRNEYTLQGVDYTLIPMSYSLLAEMSEFDGARENDNSELKAFIGEVGFKPTLQDNVFFFANKVDSRRDYPGFAFFPSIFDNSSAKSKEVGVGWSHTFAEKNVLEIFVAGRDSKQQEQFEYVDGNGDLNERLQKSRDRSLSFGVGHLLGLGPVTLRYGADGSVSRGTFSYVNFNFFSNFEEVSPVFHSTGSEAHVYGDILWDVDRSLQIQAALHYNWIEDGDCGCLGPRIGIAWAPVENHWLRAYYREDTTVSSAYTLSPVSTVGLSPAELPLFTDSRSRTIGMRWDAEWSERLFTSVEYQHQRSDGLALDVPDLWGIFAASEGRLERVTSSVNYWIGGGLGAYSTYTITHSRDTTPGAVPGSGLPLVPEQMLQAGLTYVTPARLTFTLGQTYVGTRVGWNDGTKLEDYWTTNAGVSWKSPQGHLEASLQVINLFDKGFEIADDIPAPGRIFYATVRARF